MQKLVSCPTKLHASVSIELCTNWEHWTWTWVVTNMPIRYMWMYLPSKWSIIVEATNPNTQHKIMAGNMEYTSWREIKALICKMSCNDNKTIKIKLYRHSNITSIVANDLISYHRMGSKPYWQQLILQVHAKDRIWTHWVLLADIYIQDQSHHWC